MTKPLLTDDIIEQALREEALGASVKKHKKLYFDSRDFEEEAQGQPEESLTSRIEVIPSVVKSRTIENKRRSLFQSKLNRILAVLLVLVVLLLFAVFYL